MRYLKDNSFKIFVLIVLPICKGQINMTVYNQMPPLYEFDDIGECLHDRNSDLPNIYCMIYAEIPADNSSLLWQQIDEFSNSYRFHYRHDHLFRGVCLGKYKNMYNIVGINTNLDIPENENTVFFKQFHYKSIDQTLDLKYQQLVRYSMNEEFQEKYNLSLQTLILYCENTEQNNEKGFGFKFTIILCSIIIFVNICSSFYDDYLKSKLKNLHNKYNYYEINHKNSVYRYLTTFSLYRNFRRLLVPSKNRELAFLDGFRAILSFMIVCEHVFFLQFVHLKNPEFVENLYHYFIIKVVYNAMVFVELFFVLSGLLLYIKFENGQYVTTKSTFKNCAGVYGKLILARYLRYLPSLLFLIIFSVNIFPHMENGAFGRFIIEPLCVLCRDEWWKNLLMINNFSIVNSCWSHTWYIAADFQLYAFYLLILIIVAKYPKYKMFALTFIAIVAATIPFLINYFLKLDSVPSVSLESYRNSYMKDIETGIQLYLPWYTNLNGFLVGIICGEIYMKYLRNNTKNKKKFGKILKLMPYFGWTCIMGILYLGAHLLLKEPTIWTALYGLLQRQLTIDIITITTILLMICRSGFASKLLSLTPFRLLSRISYQVYLWHFVLLFIIINYFAQPINITLILIITVLLMIYAIANIVGLIAALMVEYPIAEIFNILNFK